MYALCLMVFTHAEKMSSVKIPLLNCAAESNQLSIKSCWWTLQQYIHTHGMHLCANRCEFQFQFVSCTSSVLKRKAERRLQHAVFNYMKVCVFVQVSGFATLWLKVFFTKGSLQGHPESVNVCMCV